MVAAIVDRRVDKCDWQCYVSGGVGGGDRGDECVMNIDVRMKAAEKLLKNVTPPKIMCLRYKARLSPLPGSSWAYDHSNVFHGLHSLRTYLERVFARSRRWSCSRLVDRDVEAGLRQAPRHHNQSLGTHPTSPLESGQDGKHYGSGCRPLLLDNPNMSAKAQIESGHQCWAKTNTSRRVRYPKFEVLASTPKGDPSNVYPAGATLGPTRGYEDRHAGGYFVPRGTAYSSTLGPYNVTQMYGPSLTWLQPPSDF
ncbi:hypothetical protein Syun_031799 [Stephania yunnanensis]|uniref:Uncharacterized protein n=1 Tax=Stephania yunnanensis TaxID=152371 RepID=A0AAP0DYK6_9MAGN